VSFCVTDNYDVAQLLIDNGANLEGSDLHFGRPLHLAALRGHVRSAKVLLLAGKKVSEYAYHTYISYLMLFTGWQEGQVACKSTATTITNGPVEKIASVCCHLNGWQLSVICLCIANVLPPLYAFFILHWEVLMARYRNFVPLVEK